MRPGVRAGNRQSDAVTDAHQCATAWGAFLGGQEGGKTGSPTTDVTCCSSAEPSRLGDGNLARHDDNSATAAQVLWRLLCGATSSAQLLAAASKPLKPAPGC